MEHEPYIHPRHAGLIGANADSGLVRLVADLDVVYSSGQAPREVAAFIAESVREEKTMRANAANRIRSDPTQSDHGRAGFWRPRRFVAMVALVVALMLVGTAIVSQGLPWTHNHEQARKPLVIYSHASQAASTPEERVASASAVVLGTVGEPYGSRWNTPSGRLPEDIASVEKMPPGEYEIFTDYPVNVERVLYGSVPEATVRVRVTGGQVGQDRLIVDGMADLRPGQRVVLLLTDDDNPLTREVGPAHYRIAWGNLGTYRIMGGEAVSPDHRILLSELPAFIREAKR